MTLNDQTSRREFMSRSAKAGLAVIGACSIGYASYDPNPPKSFAVKGTPVQLPDYSIREANKRMCIVRGDNRIESLQRGLNAMGGIESFIKKGDRVLLKVNAAFALPASLSATTHPDIVKEAVRLCYAAGASAVMVTDNPINDPSSCFRLSGIEQAARSEGAQVILPRDSYFQPITVPGGQLIKDWPLLHEPLKNIQKLIGMAPIKDHYRSGASMSMKNWYGFLGGRRNIFHQDIHNVIKELAMMVRPTLVILDGTVTMMTNGPTGGSLSDLKPTGTLIISTDQVAADAYGATLLERDMEHLSYISKAEAAGVGTTDFQSLQPIII